jgi:hypothetical protein
MTTITTRCRRCSTAFEPTPEIARAGAQRLCLCCAFGSQPEYRCNECARPLQLTSRTLCDRCLGVSL